jgi:hypothetical protein
LPFRGRLIGITLQALTEARICQVAISAGYGAGKRTPTACCDEDGPHGNMER